MAHENYKHDILNRIMSCSIRCENGCIEYRPGELRHKYGLVSITVGGIRKNVPAHRAVWMATYGLWDLASNVVIRHKCDNPRCVNIDHIIDGSHADNSKDKFERDRNCRKYRPHTRHREFSDEEIRSIRAATGKLKWIAEKFGATPGYVSKIRNMKAKALVA